MFFKEEQRESAPRVHMAKTFHIDIVSPEKSLYKGEAEMLIAPSEFGYVGILADHAPLVAHLGKGKIIFKDSSRKTNVYNCEGSGFLEVLKNNVTLIVDAITRSQDNANA